MKDSCLFFVMCFLAVSSLQASPLFEDDDAIDAELHGPFSGLMTDTSVRDQLPFEFRADGVEHKLKVRVRGKSRLLVCRMPQLRLNFKKKSVEGTLFEGQDKLKLAMPCHLSERAEKDLLEEYAAYRIFNLLSPASYRVRLLHLKLTDPEDTYFENEASRYAFLIESTDELAGRNEGGEVEVPAVSLGRMDVQQLARVFVFQYLIGNTDWSLVSSLDESTCCHNGDLIETGMTTLYVPFDFDLSGLVNAPYAEPDASLRLKSVRQRRYRGFCIDEAPLREAVRAVNELEDEILAVIESLPVFTEKEKQQRIRYLTRYFDAAKKEDKLIAEFQKRCID